MERLRFLRLFLQNSDKIYKGFKIKHFSTLSTKPLWKTYPFSARHRVNRGFSTALRWITLWEMWKNAQKFKSFPQGYFVETTIWDFAQSLKCQFLFFGISHEACR